MTAHSKGQRLALAALVLGAVGIATAPIFARYSEVGPIATGFWRMALALPMLLLVARPTMLRRDQGHDALLLFLAGLFFAIDLGLYHVALKITTVANATLLSNAAPVFVALGAWLIWKQQLTRTFMVGLALVLTGALLLSVESLRAGGGQLLGDALSLFSAVFYGSYILVVGQARARHSTLDVLIWGGLSASLCFLAGSLALGERIIPEQLSGWWPLFALAAITQVAGQGLITYALAHLPAHFSSVALLVQPVAAAVLAWILFAEPLGFWQFVGSAVILGGIVLARRGSRRRK